MPRKAEGLNQIEAHSARSARYSRAHGSPGFRAYRQHPFQTPRM
jgi:hypothetical protein